MIAQSQTQTEHHLHDTDNNRELHFHGVSVVDLIDTKLPHGVQAERIRITRIHLVCRIWVWVHVEGLNIRPVEIIAHTHTPTRPEQVHLLREHVIIHEACVDTERGH